MHTLTTAKFGSVQEPWTMFNMKYILDPEKCLIHRIKLSGFEQPGPALQPVYSDQITFCYQLCS